LLLLLSKYNTTEDKCSHPTRRQTSNVWKSINQSRQCVSASVSQATNQPTDQSNHHYFIVHKKVDRELANLVCRM